MEDHFFWGESGMPCISDDFDEIRKWIEKQRFIPHDLSDKFIQRFLKARDGDVTSTKKMILDYFYLRQEPGPIFRDRNPTSPENRKLIGSMYAVPLRNVMNETEIVIITGLSEPMTTYTALGHLKLIALTIDYLLWDKAHDFTDLRILLDGRNLLCPSLLARPDKETEICAQRFQKSLPIKIQAFHIYRPPEHVKEITRVYNGIWFNVIQTPKEATLAFPCTILPFEFGGRLGNLSDILATWNLQKRQMKKFLIHFEKIMVNDYRRRMCYERDLREGGRNWVWKMKLVADECEFKKAYYERMANQEPFTHPGFGVYRQMSKPKQENKSFDPLRKMREIVDNEKCIDFLDDLEN